MADVRGDQDQDHRQEHGQDVEIGHRGVEMRQADPGGLADGREVHLTLSAGHDVADDHAQKDVQTTDKPLKEDGDEHDGQEGDHGGDGVGFEVLPSRRGQVEADDGHDGPVDHRGHDDVDPFGAGEMDDHADQGQGQTGAEDAEGGHLQAGHAFIGRRDGSDGGYKSKRATQIAR